MVHTAPRRSWRARCSGLIAATLVAAGCVGSDEDSSVSTVAPTSTSIAAAPAVVERSDWGAFFDDAGVAGTFASREVGTGETSVWNSDRASERRLPASTFKILNSMIILQTGALDAVDTVVPWDGVVREIPAWNRDHSLRSGIEVSAVWLFQELARTVGESDMAEWVDRVGYGNADIGGGIDEFWLRGDLRISPLEQLDFLEQIVSGGTPFDGDVVDAVRDIVVREQGDDWTWSHKTGTALAESPTLGWLVGTTDNGGREWVFAMNLDLEVSGVDDSQIDPQVRQLVSRQILVAEGALPDS